MVKLYIKNIRKNKGISQYELSKSTGLNQSYLSKLEREDNTISPTLKTLSKIAYALEVKPDDLFTWEE